MCAMEHLVDELARLRARVYGLPGAEPVTSAELDRLAELENVRSELAPEAVHVDRHAAEVTPPEQEPTPPEGEPTVSLSAGRRRRVRAVAVVGGIAVLTAATGFVAGALLFRMQAPAGWPELATVQSEEDVLTSAARSGLDPTSTRYIGRFDGFEIFLAKPAARDGICVVTAPGSAIAGAEGRAVACGDGNPNGGGVMTCAMFTLAVAVGPIPEGLTTGHRFRLSDSVTVWKPCPPLPGTTVPGPVVP